jgi:hypothetical protein
MSFDPYSDYYRLQSLVSNARIFHAIPNAPAVDVYLNNKRIAQNLRYGNFTQYLPLQPGTYTVKLVNSTKPSEILLTKNISVNGSSIYTIAAVGYFPKIDLQPILEPKGPIIPGKFFIRFGNLSPNSQNLDLTLIDGTQLFNNIPYRGITDYIPLNAGKYNFQIKDSKTGTLLLNVPNIDLRMSKFYSIYSIGLINDRPPLQVVIPLDGNSYIRDTR